MSVPLVTVSWAMETIEKLQTVPNFIPENEDPVVFMLDSGKTFLEVDNIGLLVFFPYESKDKNILEVHMTFWDGRFRGRERLCRSAATFVARILRKQLITAVPEDREALLAFVRRVGFGEAVLIEKRLVLLFTNYLG